MNQVISLRPGVAPRAVRSAQDIMARLRATVERHRKIALIERELYAHDDRGLADLGIARCDIPRIARSV